jgi:nucleotide-binding universal stress UspA family protein
MLSRKKKEPGDRRNGEQLLMKANQILGDIQVNRKVRRGNVVKRIIKEAENGNYDMVVMTVSKLGEGRQQTSSVHRSLFRNLPCCLLVVKKSES